MVTAVELRLERVGAQVSGEGISVERLDVSASLFADTSHGRIHAEKTMGAGMWRHGVKAIWKRYRGPLPDDP